MTGIDTGILASRTEAGYSLIDDDVSNLLGHRHPFLFIDRAEVDNRLSSARGSYRFPASEWFFAGHYPEEPIVPGVILLEVASQTTNVLLSLRSGLSARTYLTNANNVSFKAPVRPCESIVADVRFERELDDTQIGPGKFYSFRTSIRRGDVQCMRGDLTIWWER